jgi:predicted amidohydrolase
MLVAALQMPPAAAVEANLARIDQAAKSAAAFGELRAVANVLS